MFSALGTNCIPDLHLCAAVDAHQCFPFYTYSPEGTNRTDNITDAALERFRAHYGDRSVSKLDIFHYIYALLHHPGYREKYADNLKRELPRIPFAPDFRAFARAGAELMRLHVHYEAAPEYKLDWQETGTPFHTRVEDKMRFNKDRTAIVVNPTLSLAGIPPEAHEYKLGSRSAIEWVVDQYRVTEDKRSGIRQDPNNAADPEYIPRLIARVTTVSLETLRLVRSLPAFE
jgi:predicted helicase